jgi:hypothetical protein
MLQDIGMDRNVYNKNLKQKKQKQTKQMELHQTKKLLHSKGNNQRNEETA